MAEREMEYHLSRSSRGIRKKRLVEKRRKRRRRYALYAFIALLIIGLVSYGTSRLSIKAVKIRQSPKANKTTSSKRVKSPEPAKKVSEKRITFLVAGAKKADGKEVAEGILVLVLNESKKQLFAISIPENTLVDIPGLGFEKAGLALSSGGMDALYTTIRNFLEVPLDHRIKLEYENFKYFWDRDSFDSMILKSKDTDLKKDDRDKYSKAIARIDLSNIKKIPLPVKPLMMENKVYFEPIHESVDRMIEEVFGIKKEREETARVVILNGCGVPGIAGKVAKKLVEQGYKITESKNAENFNYSVTQIISFKADVTVAKKIREVLGTGEVVRKRAPQDLVDVAVIIGKDYPTE